MTFSITAAVLLYASLSAGFRGAISVIDRYQFGISRQSIAFTNLHNNVAALGVVLAFALFRNQVTDAVELLLDPRVIVFGFLLQISAQAFSYAFRHMKVPAIIVSSKAADVFIPLAVCGLFARWSPDDFLFSAATFLVCLPILFGHRKGGSFHALAALAVSASIVAQGALSPWFMSELARDQQRWIAFTAALIFWRLVLSLAFTGARLQGLAAHGRASFGNSKYLGILGLRALLTVGAQAFLVLALSLDRPVIAWPILNATGLLSLILSSLFLKEHAGKSEVVAILLITALGIAKALS